MSYADAVDQAAYHGNPVPAITAVTAAVPQSGPLIGLGLSIAYGWYQASKVKTVIARAEATTAALQQSGEHGATGEITSALGDSLCVSPDFTTRTG